MKKHSLKSSLYRVFAGSVVMPFIVISLILLFFFNYQILDGYKTSNRITLQIIVNHLHSSLKNSERFFLQYVFDDDISRFYQYVNYNEIDVSEENLYQYIRCASGYRSALNNYLTTADDVHRGMGFLPIHANRNNLFYLRKYGGFVIRYQNAAENMAPLYDCLEELSSGQVMFLPGSIMSGCEEYEEEEEIFTILCPVNHLERASRQGYVFQELKKTVFSDLVKEITLPEGAGLVIYFPDGTPAYATDELFVGETDFTADMGETMGRRIRIGTKTYYLYYMQEERYGFAVHYLLPQSAILKEANRTSLVILSFWFLAMTAAFFIFMNLSRRISVSTGAIMTYIQKYRLADKDNEQMPPMQIEEFADISLALREMTERITDLVQHEYIWKMNQQMAEYKAMQAEINPHFFHNVMNSLQALNRMEDRKNLDKGIVNLSRMFRYTCESGYESSILRECRFIESYLILEKIRFEKRLHYEIHVDTEIEDFMIPKLLLQPLVENAMRHGMPSDGSRMRIVLHAEKVKSGNGEAFVWIMIANDGVPYEEKAVYDGGRVGIVSVRERLFITYPDSFFWYDRKGEYRTVCNLLIAMENGEEDGGGISL